MVIIKILSIKNPFLIHIKNGFLLLNNLYSIFYLSVDFLGRKTESTIIVVFIINSVSRLSVFIVLSFFLI